MKKELFKLILKEIEANDNFQEIDFIKKYHFNERTIRRYFKVLRDKKMIKRVGEGKKKKWIIIK